MHEITLGLMHIFHMPVTTKLAGESLVIAVFALKDSHLDFGET